MNRLVILSVMVVMSLSVAAQTKPAPPTPPAIVSLISDVSGKHFLPDTAFATLSEEDKALLAKEPVANWGLAQESGPYITYYNLVIGTRSYQLLIAKSPKVEFATATLLRFVTPKSKPEPIARGMLKPNVDEKAK